MGPHDYENEVDSLDLGEEGVVLDEELDEDDDNDDELLREAGL